MQQRRQPPPWITTITADWLREQYAIHTDAEIAEAAGVSDMTVYKARKHLGIPSRRRGRQPGKWAAPRPAPAELQRLYDQHQSIRGVAAKIDRSYSTARKWLDEAGVQLLAPGGSYWRARTLPQSGRTV